MPGELVICSDVPLADRLVKNGVTALDPRGKEFSPQNMSERLAVRNLFTDLREQGQMAVVHAPWEKDKQALASYFILHRTKRRSLQRTSYPETR